MALLTATIISILYVEAPPLEEVQRLLLIPLWLNPIVLILHVYIPINLELPKTPRYPVMQDEKIILPILEGKRCLVKEGLTLSPAEEPKFFILLDF